MPKHEEQEITSQCCKKYLTFSYMVPLIDSFTRMNPNDTAIYSVVYVCVYTYICNFSLSKLHMNHVPSPFYVFCLFQ